ncbi:LPXTG cell wall anchor domain-containing protein, partial [Apilactobacillus sp. F1]|nr:LPXTG cell wall anchor domain-containing protein [Apilactobacillus sp. F1]
SYIEKRRLIMKFDKRDSKLFKNTKKFVYVSAITGVLLTGTQAGQFASTYTAHADETAQTSSVTITFTDQYGNTITKPDGVNNVLLASFTYPVQSARVSKAQILLVIGNFQGVETDNNNIPDSLDLSKAGSHTFVLNQPTHTLTINLVDQNGKNVETKTVPDVTNFGQTKTDDLSAWAQDNKYGYDSFPSAVNNSETTVNISVKAPTTTVVIQNTQQNNTATETTTQTSGATTVQSSASDETTKSSAQSSTSSEAEKSSSAQSSSSSDDKKESASSASTSQANKPVEQSSEATKPSAKSSESTKESSSATQNVKSEAASSVASSENVSSTATTSTESSAQSSNSSSSASQAPKSDEKTMVIVDPVNKGEKKKAAAKKTKQTPVAEKKDVRAKLPQTGDNTNQARAIALGVATIAIGLGLAYFGLRRKNK